MNQFEEEFKWLDTGLITKIPKINATKGEYMANSDEKLDVTVEGFTYTQFDEYITECKNMGYVIDASKDTNKYVAYNAEGYHLELQYWSHSKKIDIELKSPLTGDVDFKWPTQEIASLIPKMEGKSGRIENVGSEKVEFWIYDVTETEYIAYTETCVESGFAVDSKIGNRNFSGFNLDGYKLVLWYGDMKQLSVTLDAPMALSDIAWPSTGPATLIPKPSFDVGKIISDYDWVFSVYLSDMTIDDFNAYVDKCIDKGFKKDYRSEYYFSADKGEKVSLNVEYIGFNIVEIRISDYNEFGR